MINSNDMTYAQQVACPGGTLYTIRSGDTLYLLAQRYGTTVERIMAANPGINPNNLQVGQVICIPVYTPSPTCNGIYYTVRAGDTAYNIARMYGISLDALARANPGVDLSRLQVGQILCVPAYTPVPPTPIIRTCTFALNMTGLGPTYAPEAGGVIWLRYDNTGRTEVMAAISGMPDPTVFGAQNYSLVFTGDGRTFSMPLYSVYGQPGLWAGNQVFTLPTTFIANGRVDVYPGPMLTGRLNTCK